MISERGLSHSLTDVIKNGGVKKMGVHIHGLKRANVEEGNIYSNTT